MLALFKIKGAVVRKTVARVTQATYRTKELHLLSLSQSYKSNNNEKHTCIKCLRATTMQR